MLYTEQQIDFTQEDLFLGKGRNIARLDLPLEPWIEKHTKRAISKLWFPSEFNYSADADDFAKLETKLRTLYFKNLKFQTVLDSVASRSAAELFNPIVTNSVLETWFTTHSFFESIHSETYAEVIKALSPNSSDEFDSIILDEDIQARARSVIEHLNNLNYYNSIYLLRDMGGAMHYNENVHKGLIVQALNALYILESVLFETSFVITNAFAENSLLNETNKSIVRITEDEALHTGLVSYLINKLRKDPSWKLVYDELEDELVAMFKTSLDADKKWTAHLFEDGVRLFGVSETIINRYAEWNIYRRMTAIGLTPIVDKVDNPCSWRSKYLDEDVEIVVALNETLGSNYLLGVLIPDTSDSFYKGL